MIITEPLKYSLDNDELETIENMVILYQDLYEALDRENTENFAQTISQGLKILDMILMWDDRKIEKDIDKEEFIR